METSRSAYLATCLTLQLLYVGLHQRHDQARLRTTPGGGRSGEEYRPCTHELTIEVEARALNVVALASMSFHVVLWETNHCAPLAPLPLPSIMTPNSHLIVIVMRVPCRLWHLPKCYALAMLTAARVLASGDRSELHLTHRRRFTVQSACGTTT